MHWRTVFLGFSSAAVLAANPVRISEFSAAGHQGLLDEDGDTPDWIEVQNVSAETVNLNGWTLKSRNAAKWNFPAKDLPSGAFLVVFASGKDRTNGAVHTNFKLKAETGEILLLNPRGEIASAISNYPPQVAGVSFGSSSNFFGYLTHPTPGGANSPPVATGPFITSLSIPTSPEPDRPLTITAMVQKSPSEIHVVTLSYRVMLDREIAVQMKENGVQIAGGVTNTIFSADIPGSAAKAGEMIRYYVTAEDSEGKRSRWPLFARRPGISAYAGTMIPNRSINSRLPTLHLFTANSNQPVRAQLGSIHYEGEFYDNVMISPHGQISQSFPKPSYNLDFPYDHHFRYHTNQARVSDVKILGNFADPSKIRNTLAYEMIAASGSIAHFAFPLRIEKNGKFFCVAEIVEDGDDRWLERVGLDPHGALYKMYGNLFDVSQAEKKTRRNEGAHDLIELAEALTQESRYSYAIDHLNIPQCISYLVAMALISSGDHGHKNYYLYRDSEDTGEWFVLPWDVDLSWGRNWMKTYFDDKIYVDNPLTLYRTSRERDRGRNPIYNVFFDHPSFRQMYLRRLKTVVDELLEPKGAKRESIIAKRIVELLNQIDPPNDPNSDATLDSKEWPGWGELRTARQEANRILREYLPGRRDFLVNRATLYGERLPSSQPNDPRLEIVEVNERSITIQNPNNFAIDVSGWKVFGSGIEYIFRAGTVVPIGERLWIVADVRSFRSEPSFPTGKRLVQGNWTGSLTRAGTVEVHDPTGRAVTSHKIESK